ncbi:hypothetical protein A6A04_02945 [Paramagnetospirillum marisnigri]|uniref:DNA repair protein Rad52 n=1 Tax=Paramagnetospirillum marisnigri TaxID=1285242 RepID=A0A178MM01_9PROT|nr:RAD52 family DNA repair protein [Paramagnetospirillum marisnigri]OAN49095.1 hypothetical protein A6A04_02945 [Paramagnetospirillum marisnigri]
MTGFTDKQNRTLADVLDAGVVKKRQQAGQTLSYIEAWRAIDEANRIFGFDCWKRETILLDRTVLESCIKTRYNERTGKKEVVRGPDGEPVTMTRVGYLAKVRVTVIAGDQMVVREGTGYGSGFAEDPNMAFEGAAKQAESDAMKRALMTFGNPFGLALYDKSLTAVGIPDRATEDRLARAKPIADALIAAMTKAKTLEQLAGAFRAATARFDELPESLRETIIARKDDLKAALTGARKPRASLADPFGSKAA